MGKIEVVFPKLNHFWMDSGLIGLYNVLQDIKNVEKIRFHSDDGGIILSGEEKDIQDILEKAYNYLVEKYYNLSSKKQKEEKKKYNFYYDQENDKFVSFSKRKSYGIVNLIYNKASRPIYGQVKWKNKIKREIEFEGKKIKKDRGILPEKYSHLQKRLDQFLDANGLDVTTAGLLLDGPNQVRPGVDIKVNSAKPKGVCYICGNESHSLCDISQTTFPYITGSSGMLNFNSLTGKPEKVCWKCSFLGKFVPVNGFYYIDKENIYCFFPYSNSFKKVIDNLDALENTKNLDPNLFRNFNHPLGGYFHHVYEITFAFLYNIYEKTILHREDSEEEKEIIDWDELINTAASKAPLEFFVLQASSKGQTSMGKVLWSFKDSVYFFRLICSLERENLLSMKEVMQLLIDSSKKQNSENQTLIRNRVCERILKKRSILDLIEKFVFQSRGRYITPLLDLVINYEIIVREEEGPLDKETQETAVTLGKRVGMAVGVEGKKGDLFALRKSRKKTDFLSELNRLQFRYELVIPSDIYKGKLTDENFVEFKQFCMISALNSFYARTSKKIKEQSK